MNAGQMLGPWSGFYVMIGSSAAALTGLMFVVISIVNGAQRGRMQSNPEGISTFSTPTVLHFCAPLFVAGAINAPWETLAIPAVMIAAFGAYGAIYVGYLMVRSNRLQSYSPDTEDWVWYSVLPLIAYIAMCAGGVGMLFAPSKTLFAVGGASLFLIFIGIRNSWDVVTYLAVNGLPADDGDDT